MSILEWFIIKISVHSLQSSAFSEAKASLKIIKMYCEIGRVKETLNISNLFQFPGIDDKDDVADGDGRLRDVGRQNHFPGPFRRRTENLWVSLKRMNSSQA
jgi:hypothetical protein